MDDVSAVNYMPLLLDIFFSFVPCNATLHHWFIVQTDMPQIALYSLR